MEERRSPTISMGIGMRGTWHDARVATIRLAKRLEKSIRAGHPWIYREALELRSARSGLIPKDFGGSSSGELATGSAVDIIGADGKFVARGLFDSRSPIAPRVAPLDRAQPLDDAFVRARIRSALRARRGVIDAATTD